MNTCIASHRAEEQVVSETRVQLTLGQHRVRGADRAVTNLHITFFLLPFIYI